MNREDLMEALLFFASVQEFMGEARFLLHRKMIVDITVSVIEQWKSAGKETAELFKTNAMLQMVEFLIYAQEALDRIKDGDNSVEEDN